MHKKLFSRVGILFVSAGLLMLTGCVGASTGSQQVANSGPGQLTVSPATLNFGNVTVGTNKALGATLTSGNADVTVSTASWTGEGYSVSGISFPTTIPAGKTVSYTVTFTPGAAGSTPGSIKFYSDAVNSTDIENLAGVGTPSQASTHTVSLSWNASTSQVTGYNIYRSGTNGGPYSRINTTPQANTNYTDTSVASGQTYYYVTTAVDSSNQESAYSNQAPAAIPAN